MYIYIYISEFQCAALNKPPRPFIFAKLCEAPSGGIWARPLLLLAAAGGVTLNPARQPSQVFNKR